MKVFPISFPFLSKAETPIQKQMLAIGDFDGVHLGHREVILRAVGNAKKLSLHASIMTFHPHPREVLGHALYSKYLSPLQEKMELFASLGVESTYVVHFDKNFSQVSPGQFIHEMLFPLDINTVVVGFDFTFGHKGAGTADTLCELAKGSFAVEVVRPFHKHGVKVSSTRIREHLAVGEVQQANDLLDRSYSIKGDVVRGDGRGSQIGFPTANIQVTESYIIPANGVYAVYANHNGKRYKAVVNIGLKPTFHENLTQPVIEAHLLDFEGDLYGTQMRLEFIDYLRSEIKFSSVNQLVRQIQEDIANAQERIRV